MDLKRRGAYANVPPIWAFINGQWAGFKCPVNRDSNFRRSDFYTVSKCALLMGIPLMGVVV